MYTIGFMRDTSGLNLFHYFLRLRFLSLVHSDAGTSGFVVDNGGGVGGVDLRDSKFDDSDARKSEPSTGEPQPLPESEVTYYSGATSSCPALKPATPSTIGARVFVGNGAFERAKARQRRFCQGWGS
ncbi:hypothetical protein E2542_SST06084 [Spatholobus suberectus]|nr:hypothetical protein E2542_SST06084 [Spatholobus suberectus]